MFEQAKDKVDEAIGAGQEQFGKASRSPEYEVKGKVRKQLARGSYAVDDLVDSVKQQTQSSPLASLAIAVGVGFVLGKVIGRK
ncbi:CsbD family protein [Pantoea sp. B65]|uniref:CsbD family protein n=1 Tax=Pantoea sp. B65 TaxID=2813359 RepID=UPI0039B4E1BF